MKKGMVQGKNIQFQLVIHRALFKHSAIALTFIDNSWLNAPYVLIALAF